MDTRIFSTMERNKMNKGKSACRFCDKKLEHNFIDLGLSPLCQTHISRENLNTAEYFYPLHAYVCTGCFLVQLDEYVAPKDIFSQYDYFSSYSDSWVLHAKNYVDRISKELQLNDQSLVVEIASNDGYLLQHFLEKSIPILGIEPAENIASVAQRKGIRTVPMFFDSLSSYKIEHTYGKADLLIGNNVLAHVPDINDFVKGMKILLKESGTITMEFPHLLKLIEHNQYDTIYHEHFSYLSLYTVEKIFSQHDITIFDVEEIDTHGGSLRIYGRHSSETHRHLTPRLHELRDKEISLGINKLPLYKAFEKRVKSSKRKLLEFLINAKNEGNTVVGYGAPGKGNTLLNYCGIRQDFIDYTVDISPQKQGKFTPGTRIPILHPRMIEQTKPDYILILPWNLTTEITHKYSFISDWGGRFVIPIPEIRVLDPEEYKVTCSD